MYIFLGPDASIVARPACASAVCDWEMVICLWKGCGDTRLLFPF